MCICLTFSEDGRAVVAADAKRVSPNFVNDVELDETALHSGTSHRELPITRNSGHAGRGVGLAAGKVAVNEAVELGECSGEPLAD
jgi:hypothetical protein